MTQKCNSTHVGTTLDDFLAEEGLFEEATALAVKRVLAWEISQAMEKEELSKTVMARRMGTSRAALDRLLDPENTSVTLHTLDRAAAAVGRRLELRLVESEDAAT